MVINETTVQVMENIQNDFRGVTTFYHAVASRVCTISICVLFIKIILKITMSTH